MKTLLCVMALASFSVQSAGQPNQNLLPAKDSMELLAEVVVLRLDTTHTLNLEPGIRATQFEGAYTFSTYDGKKVIVEIGTETLAFASPVTMRLTDRGWEFNGAKPVAASSVLARRQAQDDTDNNLKSMQESTKAFVGSPLLARRQNQDDADSNLKSMQESAKKLKTKSNEGSQKKAPVRWLYTGNPFAGDEPFNQAAIQQLTHISALGF